MTIASGKKIGRPRTGMAEVLADLALHDGWARPMDIGGTSGSHHTSTLTRLCRHGLVERRRRQTAANAGIGRGHVGLRGSWEYRITRLGRRALVPR